LAAVLPLPPAEGRFVGIFPVGKKKQKSKPNAVGPFHMLNLKNPDSVRP
jgi:hypothetical protein